jgi:hypothetical protein
MNILFDIDKKMPMRVKIRDIETFTLFPATGISIDKYNVHYNDFMDNLRSGLYVPSIEFKNFFREWFEPKYVPKDGLSVILLLEREAIISARSGIIVDGKFVTEDGEILSHKEIKAWTPNDTREISKLGIQLWGYRKDVNRQAEEQIMRDLGEGKFYQIVGAFRKDQKKLIGRYGKISKILTKYAERNKAIYCEFDLGDQKIEINTYYLKEVYRK